MALEDLQRDCRSLSELPNEVPWGAGSKSLGLEYGRVFEGRTYHLALIVNQVISCFKFPFYS